MEREKTGWKHIKGRTDDRRPKIGIMAQTDSRNRREMENMEVSVLFFGVLADIAGTHSRHYPEVKSFNDLRHRIEDDFPELFHYNFRIAVNNEIVDDDPILGPGDEIAFLPPFAGG
jgi:molybdopterin converting factor small subunit